jgi:hypothetical protein
MAQNGVLSGGVEARRFDALLTLSIEGNQPSLRDQRQRCAVDGVFINAFESGSHIATVEKQRVLSTASQS